MDAAELWAWCVEGVDVPNAADAQLDRGGRGGFVCSGLGLGHLQP